MMPARNSLLMGVLLLSACATFDDAAKLRPGLIESDQGGAAGYQHGLQRSQFRVGLQPRAVIESGWSKQVGPEGAFAVSLHNGVAMALPNAHAQTGPKSGYPLDPEKHNQQVLNYFAAAGIPKDQIGGVHTMTRLSLTGHQGEIHASQPKVDGYISVLERKVDTYLVPDSVAWAQMDNEGNVISEGVYWPAIPGKAVQDARRMKNAMATASEKSRFLARIPPQLPPGQIVIRHSSAAAQQEPFEVFASYDVLEQRASREPASAPARVSVGESSTIMRHFDAEGVERRLPQERRNAEKDYPTREKSPPSSAAGKQ